MRSQILESLERFWAGVGGHPLRSFKSRLIAWSVGAFVIFLWALVFFSASIQQRQFSDVLLDQQFTSTQRLAADLDSKLEERIRALAGVAAKLPDTLDPVALDRHLANLGALHSLFSAAVLVMGLDGHVIAEYPVVPGRRGTYYGDRDYFTRVVETPTHYIDKPLMGRILKRPLLNISVPVFDRDGTLRAVLVGVTDLSAPNFFGSILNKTISGKGDLFVISPHDKLIVASTNATRVMTALPERGANLMVDRFMDGFEGSGIATSSTGIPKLYSGKYVPTAHWLVMAALPTEVAFRPVEVMRNYLVIVAGILTLLAVFFIQWLTRHMLAPLDKASRAMRQMAEGATPRVALPVKREDEIGGLIDNLNVLVANHHRHAIALADSEQRFRLLAENAPDAIAVLTRGCFSYLNRAALQLLGAESAEQLRGIFVRSRIHPDCHAIADARLRLVSDARQTAPPIEYKLLRLDGTVVHAELTSVPYHYENEDGMLVFAQDITERKRANEAIRKSEERFQRLVALSSEWYWEQDAHYRFIHIRGWSTEKENALSEQLIGRTRWELAIGGDESVWTAHRAVLDARLPFMDFEYKGVAKDGSVVWFSANGEPQFDEQGVFIGYQGTGKNITERKLAEEALRRSEARIRELAAHQARIKEEERKRIARDIHDDLGQTLLTLRIDVSMLAARTVGTHPYLHNKVDAVLTHLDATMKSVRAIINDLRPSVLDLGLLAAIEWQIREFGRISGIACVLDVTDVDFDRYLDEDRSIALFRAVQESLTNIVRHARASQARISLHAEGEWLAMTIADNGVGITPDCRNKKNSFGLVGVEERISALGGTVVVDSHPGQGTVLRLSVPIAESARRFG